MEVEAADAEERLHNLRLSMRLEGEADIAREPSGGARDRLHGKLEALQADMEAANAVRPASKQRRQMIRRLPSIKSSSVEFRLPSTEDASIRGGGDGAGDSAKIGKAAPTQSGKESNVLVKRLLQAVALFDTYCRTDTSSQKGNLTERVPHATNAHVKVVGMWEQRQILERVGLDQAVSKRMHEKAIEYARTTFHLDQGSKFDAVKGSAPGLSSQKSLPRVEQRAGAMTARRPAEEKYDRQDKAVHHAFVHCLAMQMGVGEHPVIVADKKELMKQYQRVDNGKADDCKLPKVHLKGMAKLAFASVSLPWHQTHPKDSLALESAVAPALKTQQTTSSTERLDKIDDGEALSPIEELRRKLSRLQRKHGMPAKKGDRVGQKPGAAGAAGVGGGSCYLLPMTLAWKNVPRNPFFEPASSPPKRASTPPIGTPWLDPTSGQC